MEEQKNTIEVEAITVEKAVKKALEMMNAKKQEVTIRVLNEPQNGLFGMQGAQLAKIRVTLKKHK
ncbi:MAG: Jag N-terminal domain-containing protein [Candidatus Omnitrophota bacterium]